jgi:hypothetical protein
MDRAEHCSSGSYVCDYVRPYGNTAHPYEALFPRDSRRRPLSASAFAFICVAYALENQPLYPIGVPETRLSEAE